MRAITPTTSKRRRLKMDKSCAMCKFCLAVMVADSETIIQITCKKYGDRPDKICKDYQPITAPVAQKVSKK